VNTSTSLESLVEMRKEIVALHTSSQLEFQVMKTALIRNIYFNLSKEIYINSSSPQILHKDIGKSAK
jgi:hypothetical protein